MADLTPPGPSHSSGANVAGLILGAVAGVLAGVAAGVVLLFTADSLTSGRPCISAIPAGIFQLAIVVLLAFLSWYLLFRVKAQTFGPSFLRAFATAVTVMMLIPWPCSLTGLAYLTITHCSR